MTTDVISILSGPAGLVISLALIGTLVTLEFGQAFVPFGDAFGISEAGAQRYSEAGAQRYSEAGAQRYSEAGAQRYHPRAIVAVRALWALSLPLVLAFAAVVAVGLVQGGAQ